MSSAAYRTTICIFEYFVNLIDDLIYIIMYLMFPKQSARVDVIRSVAFILIHIKKILHRYVWFVTEPFHEWYFINNWEV